MRRAWVPRLPARLIRARRRIGQHTARYPDVRQVHDVDDVPDSPHPRSLYLVRGKDGFKWVAFDCPCGRGHTVLLNVSAGSSWSVNLEGPRVTLHPSVDRKDGAQRCHFFLREGRVRWS